MSKTFYGLIFPDLAQLQVFQGEQTNETQSKTFPQTPCLGVGVAANRSVFMQLRSS